MRLASGGWASVESASFAIGPDTRTPMDYNILAFGSREEAQAADRDGRARLWPDVIIHLEAR